MEQTWKDLHEKGGYELLYTPHIANVELWKTSGHFDFYADGMFDQMDVASCVEITFRTPHAMTRQRPRDGVAIPRHRRDVVPVTVSARRRGGSLADFHTGREGAVPA